MDIDEQELYICDNIEHLNYEDKKIVIQMIYSSNHRDKLNEKGEGTELVLTEDCVFLVQKLYKFISKKIKEQEEELKNI